MSCKLPIYSMLFTFVWDRGGHGRIVAEYAGHIINQSTWHTVFGGEHLKMRWNWRYSSVFAMGARWSRLAYAQLLRCLHTAWASRVKQASDTPVCLSRDLSLPVVLLPDWGNTRHGRTGIQLGAGPVQICIPPSEPSCTDAVQDQGGGGEGPACGTFLAQLDLVPRTCAPRDSSSLADSSEEGSTDSETGHLVAPTSRPLKTSYLAPGRDTEVLGDLPQ